MSKEKVRRGGKSPFLWMGLGAIAIGIGYWIYRSQGAVTTDSIAQRLRMEQDAIDAELRNWRLRVE